MRRRRCLALLATAGSLAGCVTVPLGRDGPNADPDDGNDRPPDTPTDEPDGTPTTDTDLAVGDTYLAGNGGTVTVSNARVRRAIPTLSLNAAHVDVAAYRDSQFVVVDVHTDRPTPTAMPGTASEPATPTAASPTPTPPGATPGTRADREPSTDPGPWIVPSEALTVEVDGERNPADDLTYTVGTGGALGLRVPVGSVDDAAVVWPREDDPTVRWALDGAVRDALARSPRFEVSDFAAPERVERGAAFEASVRVSNVGDRDGRFLAEFGARTASDVGETTLDVPEGETRTHSARLSPAYPEELDGFDVVLDWGVDSRTRPVEVR